VKVFKNPSRKELAKQLKQDGVLRALKDPETGNIYTWKSEGGPLHIEFVEELEKESGKKYGYDVKFGRYILKNMQDADDNSIFRR